MTECTLDSSTVDWIIDHPEVQTVLEDLGSTARARGGRWSSRVAGRGLSRGRSWRGSFNLSSRNHQGAAISWHSRTRIPAI
jgi:hypothetical protein